MINVLLASGSESLKIQLVKEIDSVFGMKTVGTSSTGIRTIKEVKRLGPDVVLMDSELTQYNCEETTKKIILEWPVPIIIFGEENKTSSKFLKAMESGAVDVITYSVKNSTQEVIDLLIKKIKIAATARLIIPRQQKIERKKFNPQSKKIVVIGISTGGPQTLTQFLPTIPKNMPVPIIIVQHMPAAFVKSYAERLDSISEIKVKLANDREEIKEGIAYIAPGGVHTELREIDGKVLIKLNEEPPEFGLRPTVNRLFKSAAAIFGENTIGVIMTGMGDDGLEGARSIKRLKGLIIAQSEKTCVIYGMPKSIVENNLADEVVDLDKIPVAIMQAVDV